MPLMDFSIDTSGTPEDVKRRQTYADALLKQAGDTSPIASPWQGVNRLAQGLLGGIERGQARSEEQQGRSAYQQQLASALGSGGSVSPQAMITLAGNPWANPAQTQAITHVADMQAQKARQAVEDQHWKASYGLQAEAAKRAAESSARANMTPDEIAAERVPLLARLGIQPGSPQGQYFLANGKLPDPTPSSGWTQGADGTMRPVPGGPADPNYIAQAAQAKGPSSVVNVDTKAPDSYDKIMADGIAKSHAALAGGVEDAQARARDLAAMQGAVDAIQKGGGTTGGLAPNQRLEMQKSINAGAAALGISTPFDEKDISDKEFLTKFNRQIAGAQAKNAVGSRVTNFEMSNYLKANPGLEMSVTGNQRLIGIQAQIEQRNVAVGQAIRDHVLSAIAAKKTVDPRETDSIIKKYDEAHHVVDPVTGQDLTQSYTLPEFQQQGTNPALSDRHEQNIGKIRVYDPATGDLK